MFRVMLTYYKRSIGDDYDYDCDLDYSYIKSDENIYIYKNLEYSDIFELLEKELTHLYHVKNGEISICYMDEE